MGSEFLNGSESSMEEPGSSRLKPVLSKAAVTFVIVFVVGGWGRFLSSFKFGVGGSQKGDFRFLQ